jgi:GABA permease
MRRYLVVANQTLDSDALWDWLVSRVKEGPSALHVLVPVTHPSGSWTDTSVCRQAEERLREAEAHFAGLGAAEVTGEVGDVSPFRAVDDVLIREEFDEIVVSTLPPGPSRWLKLDAVHRIRVAHPDVPVSHVIATRPLVGPRA